MSSGQELFHYVKSELDWQRQHTDGTPHWEPSAHEVPKPEHILSSNPELTSFLQVSWTCTNMLPNDVFSLLVAKLLVSIQKPLLATFGVEDSLCSGKCFRIDEDESFFYIQPQDCSVEIDRVDICQELYCSILTGFLVQRVWPQGFVDELNWQVTSSNTNDNQVDQLFPRGSSVLPISDRLWKSFDSIQNAVDILQHITNQLVFRWVDGWVQRSSQTGV